MATLKKEFKEKLEATLKNEFKEKLVFWAGLIVCALFIIGMIFLLIKVNMLIWT